jgi:hypothetical protein
VPSPVEGKFWRLPQGMYVLDCGTSRESVVQLQTTDLSPIEFRIFKYNGWYCITCVAERLVAQAASKKDKTENPGGVSVLLLFFRARARRKLASPPC